MTSRIAFYCTPVFFTNYPVWTSIAKVYRYTIAFRHTNRPKANIYRRPPVQILTRRSKTFKTPAHDDVIKWKHFPCYWPFVQGVHRSPVNSPQKGQWRGALMFSLICAWINGWVNHKAVDLKCFLAHYDITVMKRVWRIIPMCIQARKAYIPWIPVIIIIHWVKINDALSRVTLKCDGWPWKIIEHLFYATSSFALCIIRSHCWIQTGVTVLKRLSCVLTSVTLTFDPWPWPFAWTSILS